MSPHSGGAGLTLEERVRQINQRIADVLSLPELRRRQIPVEVRLVGNAAAIVAADITIMTVTQADAAGTGVPVYEVATQWGARLAEGLRRALPGREVIARMYAQPSVPRPGDAERLIGTTWYWQGTLMNDGSPFVPNGTAGGSVQPQPPVAPIPQPPFGGGTVAIGQRFNGGQVRLNVGDILKVRLAGQGWTATQVDFYLMHQLGTGGFVLGQELNFRAVNPGTFVLILALQGSGSRFSVGVTIGYGLVPFQQRDPQR